MITTSTTSGKGAMARGLADVIPTPYLTSHFRFTRATEERIADRLTIGFKFKSPRPANK